MAAMQEQYAGEWKADDAKYVSIVHSGEAASIDDGKCIPSLSDKDVIRNASSVTVPAFLIISIFARKWIAALLAGTPLPELKFRRPTSDSTIAVAEESSLTRYLLARWTMLKSKLVSYQRETDTSGPAWRPFKQLKYYKSRSSFQRSPQSTEAHTLRFSDKPFASSNLPAGIPERIANMKLEANRLESFRLTGSEHRLHFQAACDFIDVEELAANGFYYMQTGDKVKCAFCLGVLADWQRGETPQEAHRHHFSTCPLVLGLDVGNVPRPASQPTAKMELRRPQQCSEASEDSRVAEWTTMLDAREASVSPPTVGSRAAAPELTRARESLFQLGRRGALPVSAATAAAACDASSVENLELLASSLRARSAASFYPPASANFAPLAARYASVAGTQFPVPADLLADAGFYADADGGSRCFSCDLRVLLWHSADDPWVEHARWAPRCAHVLLSRGVQFVLSVRLLHPPYPPQRQQQQRQQRQQQQQQPQQQQLMESETQTLQMLAGNSLVDYRIEPRHFKAREDFPSALTIRQLGFEQDDVKTALLLQLKTRGDDFQSEELFVSSVLRCQSERNERGVSAREYHEAKSKEIDVARRREPKPFEGDELDWKACKVCMDKVINVTLLDCGHLCCCSLCVKQLDTCPVCRAQIKATVYINL